MFWATLLSLPPRLPPFHPLCPAVVLRTTMTVSLTVETDCVSDTDLRDLADVGAYSFGMTHPMKPQRMRITHELLSAYDMLPKMRVLVSVPCPCAGYHVLGLTTLSTEGKTRVRGGHDEVSHRRIRAFLDASHP